MATPANDPVPAGSDGYRVPAMANSASINSVAIQLQQALFLALEAKDRLKELLRRLLIPGRR